ncbi:hypothetical protein COB72_03370 [bacterium]|nr:MAG: hypothetical protein COB72_03370 [bacterium]
MKVASQTQTMSNISGSVPSKKYMKLTDMEQSVISMLDSFAPDHDATAWACDYDTLMQMAKRSPRIEQDEIIAIIGRLTGFNIIDSSISLTNEKMEVWVSPWSYRHQLRHAINDELIKRRSNMVDSAATLNTEPTQAA